MDSGSSVFRKSALVRKLQWGACRSQLVNHDLCTSLDLKTLQPQDFETWRMHLRSFIPERPTGAPQRIYVASQGGTELVSVDLSQVFTSLETVDRLMDEVASKVVELKQADKKKGQGLLGVFQRCECGQNRVVPGRKGKVLIPVPRAHIL